MNGLTDFLEMKAGIKEGTFRCPECDNKVPGDTEFCVHCDKEVTPKSKQDSTQYNEQEKGPDFFLTEPDKSAEDVISDWEEDQAIGLARELIEKLGEPDYVEEAQIVWNDVNDPVEERLWDQAIVRDMADPHKDHEDSLLATKHIDWESGQREAIHRVEGVIATPGTHVVIACGDFNGINAIFDWVQKAGSGDLPEQFSGGGSES